MARYYDSTVGRFCSADPVGGETNDPQTWNRYTYSQNDPIDFTDPSGQHWWNWALEIGSIAAIIFAPEIEGFLGDEFPLTFGGAGAPADFVPQFSVRVATEAAAEAAGDAAAAGASGGGIGAVATLTATAAQAADDLPRPTGQGPWSGITVAAAGANDILSHKNPCSQWLDRAASKLSPPTTAAAVFNAVQIVPSNLGGAAGAAVQGSGATGPIWINPWGSAYPPVGGVSYPNLPYAAGSVPWGMTVLLHELAHKLNAIPLDHNDPVQSQANTTDVLKHCQSAINGD